MAETKLLKLRAMDAEDLQILSAVLQDAIVPVCDMVWQRTQGQFVLVAQRLRREAGAGDGHERICAALTITGVTAAQVQKIDLNQQTHMVDLLALMPEADGTAITLVFAGGARVRLTVGSLTSGTWAAALEDFGTPWPALRNPCHEQGDEAVGKA